MDADLNKWLGKQAAKAGIAKTSYIIQVLEEHKRSTGDSTKDSTTDSTAKATNIDVASFQSVESTTNSTSAALESRLLEIENRLANLELSDSTKDSTNDSTKDSTNDSTNDSTKDSTKDSTDEATPIAVVELESITPQVAPQQTPQLQPTTNVVPPSQLKKADFAKLMGIKLNSPAYQEAVNASKSGGGCLDKDGNRWFLQNSASGLVWTKSAVEATTVIA